MLDVCIAGGLGLCMYIHNALNPNPTPPLPACPGLPAYIIAEKVAITN